jgi:hypothetical protein
MPPASPARSRRCLAAVVATLSIAAVLAGSTAAAPPAEASHPAGTQLALGTISILTDNDPQGCQGQECHKFQVACPGLAAARDGWYSINRPTGTARGALVFFSGGGGDFYWAREKKGADILIDRLLQDGFAVMQVRWASAWEDAAAGEVAGAHVGCRPSTIVSWLHDNEYVPDLASGKVVQPPGAAVCGFCITGPSGGSAQVAYTLSHFGLEAKLDGVFPISGPTHAALVKGCIPDRRFEDQYRFDGASTRRIDGPLGYSASSGPFAVVNGPCRNGNPAWADAYLALGVDTGGSDYQHPATRVHVAVGQLDKVMRAHAGDYVRRLAEGAAVNGSDDDASPFVGFELIAGMGHGITEFTDGRPLSQATELEHFPGLARLRLAYLLTDVSRLPACNNGLDDDGDGTTDAAGAAPDPGCASAADASEQERSGPACDNGVDEDGDGRYDTSADEFSDRGCASPSDAGERFPAGEPDYQCDDGVDNDADGRVDFPADPGCTAHDDKFPGTGSERQPTGGGFPPVICDDGVDNDGDGLKDFKIGGGGDPDCPAPEGTSETPTVTFGDDLETSGETGVINVPVELTSPQAGTVTVGYSTSNGTATAGADYTAASGGTVSFQPSEVEESIPITLLSDTRDELDETFTITLSGPTGGVTLGDAAITVTITDDDPPPALSVSGSTVPEGNSGTRTVRFTVTLTPVSGKTVSVSYATANGTASAGSDYVARSGTLTFTPGVTSGFVDVVVNGDTVPEANETFSLLLSGPVNATVGTGSASSTITNDDAAGTSSLSIADGSVTEGNGSSVNLQLTITLTPASSQTVTVSWATSNGTAVAPGDYTAKSTTATFSPGVVSRTISVPVNGDTLNENDETFTVTLSNPTNATIADGTATGTITNDDAAGAATLTVKDGSLLEPDTGTNGSLKVKITLSAASTQTITVQFATVGGTAAEGSDYQKKTGTVTFQPGQTSKTVSVSIVGDTAGENDETFTVTLSNPTNATIADAQATCTIVDDD